MTDSLRVHSAYARVYLDDIPIFSPDPETLSQNARTILSFLKDHHHVVNWDECVFHGSSIEWVGHQISGAGIPATDTSRGQIQALGVPQDKTDVKVFLGHVGYLQDLIPNYAHRSQPLTKLLVRDTRCIWSTRCQAAFEDLKNAVANVVPVQSFDPSLPIQVHTDASHFAAAAVLLQPSRQDATRWYPVEYRSRKFDIHQRNWDIHVKEFWAVKNRFPKSSANTTATSTPSSPLTRGWMSHILHYNFQLLFQPGALNVLADHLLRNPALNPQTVTPVGAVMSLSSDSIWLDSFSGAYPEDPFFEAQPHKHGS